jgi:uncharacterized protein YndB with AHSA1/START domain
MAHSELIYVTYIRATQEKVWSALTSPESIKQYWFGVQCECDFTAGSSWKMVAGDGQVLDVGAIVVAVPQQRLAIQWQNQSKPELKLEGESLCPIELETSGTAAKLSLAHSIERDHSQLIAAVSIGWPKVLSNLKSLLETGSVALQDPYTTGNPYKKTA